MAGTPNGALFCKFPGNSTKKSHLFPDGLLNINNCVMGHNVANCSKRTQMDKSCDETRPNTTD